MRTIKLDEWINDDRRMPLVKKPPRRRPSTKESLQNSFEYMKLRSEYLERKGILVQTGPREWRLRYGK